MAEAPGQGLKLILCGKRVIIRGKVQGWAKKYEKPLRTVSLLKKDLWLTEASLFKPGARLLYYPPQLKEEQVRRILRRERRKRFLWLVGFALLLPLTVPLTPIPGPNIPYFYALGRLILHFRSYRSLGKILKEGKFLPLTPSQYEILVKENCPR